MTLDDASDSRLLVTLVTYNERENLPRLIPQILQHAPDADILVVDDNSPDGTGQWCDEFARGEPRLRCLHRRHKAGVGSATIAALRYALEQNYQVVLNLDADLSHPPQQIPALRRRLQDPPVDVVVGSRYVAGGRIAGWPLTRRLLSRGVNCYARWILRIPLRDCSGAYRCFRVEILRGMPWERIQAMGYAFEEELLWWLRRRGARFAEVPITFVDRRYGSSKTNWRESASAVGSLLRLGWRTWFPSSPDEADAPGA